MGHGSLFDRRLLGESPYSPRIYAYYFKQWERFNMDSHRHDSTEIMYVIQGECVVAWEGEDGKERSDKLAKGDFVVLDALVPHRLVVEGACRMLNVEFGFAERSPDDGFPSIGELAARELSLRELISASARHLALKDPDDVYHALRSLVLELDRKETNDGGVMERLLLSQLLIRIARLRGESQLSGGAGDTYVKKCIGFLGQNYDRPLSVQEAAAHVNVHPGYLQRIFKAQTGRTLVAYLTELRMEKAKMLLLHTDIPIADVSDYVGAGSRQYFHEVFKKHTGLTPLAFRNSMDRMVRTYE
ncbi:helix-turn-helix domain-containing protein [Cohnella suwonensis]|uniref:Helix-turn-helix domain-containing protein n=1 Tax=Cohnella suwonensis TaxID=696072 RepID=A0ABW0LRQ3_9BACL